MIHGAQNGRSGSRADASSAPAGAARPDARDVAARRLDACGRYARILVDQLSALDEEAPDLDRFHALAQERTAVAREIDGLAVPPAGDPELDDVVARMRARLAECWRTDQALLSRLAHLRDDTGRALRGLESRKAARDTYALTGGEDAAHLDVKL